MDRLTPQRRSWNMSRIRSKDTAPELLVRKYLFSKGLRYRLNRKDMPGKPDLVFTSRRICLFVHGCFWHGCPLCSVGRRVVKSNSAFWKDKISGNRQRDKRHTRTLRSKGWKVFTIWECSIRDTSTLKKLAYKIIRAPRF